MRESVLLLYHSGMYGGGDGGIQGAGSALSLYAPVSSFTAYLPSLSVIATGTAILVVLVEMRLRVNRMRTPAIGLPVESSVTLPAITPTGRSAVPPMRIMTILLGPLCTGVVLVPMATDVT